MHSSHSSRPTSPISNSAPLRTLTGSERLCLVVFAVAGSIIRLAPALRSVTELTIRPFVDDAFYVFAVSRNLAHGHGLSADGTHLTNGVQPLIAFLYVPLFWLAGDNDWLAVRLVFLLSTIFFVGGLYALSRLIRRIAPATPAEARPSPVIVAGALWTLSISLFYHSMNGLETGLYGWLLLLAMERYLALRDDPVPSGVWQFGVLLGVTVLTRIDATILVAILCAQFALRRRLREALMIGGIAALISLPWWIYNVTCFGSLMPVSGQAEGVGARLNMDNIQQAVATLSDIASILFYAPYGIAFFKVLLWAGGVVLLWSTLLVATGAWRRVWRGTRFNELVPFLVFSAILLIYYTFFFTASHFIQRYLHPLRMIWFAVAALLIGEAVSAYAALPANRRRLRQAFAVGVLLCSVAFGVNRYAQNFSIPEFAEFYHVGLWARSQPEIRVGMLQSGTAMFVANNVVNLDGKVNAEALRARQQGLLGEYIAREHFAYLVDWKPFVEDIAGMARSAGAEYDSIGWIGRVQVMKLRKTSGAYGASASR